MLGRSRLAGAGVALCLLLSGAACGDDAGVGEAMERTEGEAVGPVTVFAAASLTEALTDLQGELRASDPRLDLTYSFAGSGTLVRQIQDGAPADVIATADLGSMQQLVDAGLVEEPVTFATNRLEILVAPGNPLGITGLADLARDGVQVVLGDESVPVGRYTADVLDRAGVTVSPVSRELDVKAAVARVTSGEADAAIVYATDVRAAGDAGTGVVIPDDQNLVAEYPIAVVADTGNGVAAQLFVDDVVHGAGQDSLRARGFGPA